MTRTYGGVKIEGAVALVTGSNRGLGNAFVRGLLDAGAAKVYAAARSVNSVTEGDATPAELDIRNDHHITAAANAFRDVTLLVNNAGIARFTPLIGTPSMDAARDEITVNYLGTLAMCRAFAPVLAANGGGAIVNILSVVSFFSNPENGSYGASKAAEWSLTNGVRIELASQGTLVVGVHAGFINTEMVTELARGLPKDDPQDVARQVFDAVEAGQVEVLADQRTRRIKSLLPDD